MATTIKEDGAVFAQISSYFNHNSGHRKIYIKDFCNEYGYSTRTLQRILEKYNTNWRNLIALVRLNAACNYMLNNPGESISDIAKQFDYTPARFAEAVRKRYGMTPSKFREKYVTRR